MIQYVSIILVRIGLYGLLTEKNIIKLLVSIHILELSFNIFIIFNGIFKGGIAPILTSLYNSNNLNFVDPLPQAIVLTAIVIGLGITALGLAFARKVYNQYGTFELDKMEVTE